MARACFEIVDRFAEQDGLALMLKLAPGSSRDQIGYRLSAATASPDDEQQSAVGGRGVQRFSQVLGMSRLPQHTLGYKVNA